MTIREDLATLLQTSDARLDARLIGLRIAPVCSRCGGSGNYSFNQIDGSRCYGCNGTGHVKPRAADLPGLLDEARACTEDGRLDAYLAVLAARQTLKSGQKRVMGAWSATTVATTNTGISHLTRSDELEGLAELRAANAVMSEAYQTASDALTRATYPKRDTSPADRDALTLAAAQAVETALTTISNADYQPPSHLVDEAERQVSKRKEHLAARWGR